MSRKKEVIENFAKFIEKHLCLSLFFNKVAGFQSETLLKKRFLHQSFTVNITEFLRASFI